MKLSVRAAPMVVVVILMMAMVAPSATAVAPGRRGHDVRCSSSVAKTGSSAWGRRWQIRFVLQNNRNQRTTVHGRWQVDTSGYVDTHRHGAELAAGEREVFYLKLQRRPIVDLLRCAEAS